MSYKKKDGSAALLVAAVLAVVFGAFGYSFSEEKPPAPEVAGTFSGEVEPFEENVLDNPYVQGSAPFSGGLNEGMGEDILPGNSSVDPPRWFETDQEPGPFDDPYPMVCSRVTYAGKNINATVQFIVPAGWSVWRCIEERFPERASEFIPGAVEFLQERIDADATLPVRDVNVVPVGYTFAMAGDGAGPFPSER